MLFRSFSRTVPGDHEVVSVSHVKGIAFFSASPLVLFVVIQPDEFLISISHGTDNQENAWFVLTNRRLLQKNGETNDYREFYLKDIKEYGIDRQKAELSIKTRTGETVTLKNVLGFPKKKYMDVLISSY